VNPVVNIIGAGLAGSEAALVLARNGIKVRLSEMRPLIKTPVHEGANLAEIVCSNSLGSLKVSTAGGCLKRELALLSSPLLEIAINNRVPAGHALAVDREIFSGEVTRRIESESNIELVREEVDSVNPAPDAAPTLIASGPLTSDILLRSISLLLGEENLFFFDAISPSVTHESIDLNKTFYGSRYETDATDYLNCPFTKDEYLAFYDALINAERIEIKDFEPDKLFEGCLPAEIVADRDIDALRFGAMKPVGLEVPRTGNRPYAVVQLRREQGGADTPYSWNLVGFQTRLKYPEQMRVFRMIPGLENAEFVRFGSMHKNAYLKSPYLLEPTLQISEFPNVLVAGCLAGVEGYVEDIATGHLAALALVSMLKGWEFIGPPSFSMHGALVKAITNIENIPFQPQAATMGLLPQFETNIRGKKDRRTAITSRCLDSIIEYVKALREKGYEIPDAIRIPEK
jgi:methylenetetrahydrofolate--tRNA-(uracil-5-)-methyltransferase